MKKWKEIIAGIGKDKLLLLAIAGILLLVPFRTKKKKKRRYRKKQPEVRQYQILMRKNLSGGSKKLFWK